MHVLVLGATGYIGSAAVDRLLETGHRVTAVSRSAAPDARPGVAPVAADLADTASVAALVTDDVDAVLHTAAPLGQADLALADALVGALTGSARPLVWTSGVWVLGPTGSRPADETAAPAPIAIVGSRPQVESRVLSGASRAVRSVVVRPGIVHGRGGGIPAMLVDWARAHGEGRWVVGTPGPRWPLVHVDDLAELLVLAVTTAAAGTVLHAVAEPGTSVEDLALAATEAADVAPTAAAWSQRDAALELGADLAEALALDQVVTAGRARSLGWSPSRADAVTDLATGSYAPARRPVGRAL